MSIRRPNNEILSPRLLKQVVEAVEKVVGEVESAFSFCRFVVEEQVVEVDSFR